MVDQEKIALVEECRQSGITVKHGIFFVSSRHVETVVGLQSRS